ncbi:MAG: chaperonin GroEL, partial [Planctomycetales bacterium]
AVISVGAHTETDMKQKKGRVEDTLHATRAAVEEGILPGGGVAFLRCEKTVTDLAKTLKGDEVVGANIVLKALKAPLQQIADNCGNDDGAVVVDNVREMEGAMGYNANTGKYVDLVEAGIIDPLKVSRCALGNAASISALMLTTECLVTNFEQEDKDKRKVEGSVR